MKNFQQIFGYNFVGDKIYFFIIFCIIIEQSLNKLLQNQHKLIYKIYKSVFSTIWTDINGFI